MSYLRADLFTSDRGFLSVKSGLSPAYAGLNPDLTERKPLSEVNRSALKLLIEINILIYASSPT